MMKGNIGLGFKILFNPTLTSRTYFILLANFTDQIDGDVRQSLRPSTSPAAARQTVHGSDTRVEDR